MRNICISQAMLNFFTKRLTPDEKAEVETTLTKVPGGYQIAWVAESIEKRKEYSESRRKNRSSNRRSSNNISTSYDVHMENEIENESVIELDSKKEPQIFGQPGQLFVTVKSKYLGQPPKRIYDLHKYFEAMGQAEGLIAARLIKFNKFMENNPSAMYEDDNHLYHAFKKFCTKSNQNGIDKVRETAIETEALIRHRHATKQA